MINFTYEFYTNLINIAKRKGYRFCEYKDLSGGNKIILRHDVDFSLHSAVCMAELESNLGVRSTYFLILTSNFYNLANESSISAVRQIMSEGHNIGLHFDEMNYREHIGQEELVKEDIMQELFMLSKLLDREINIISYHRPSQNILDSELVIPGVINTYSSRFFKDFKYISDSRRNWREPVEEILEHAQYPNIQMLTHPFWYHNREETMSESLIKFVLSAKRERYKNLDNNFTRLSDVLRIEEI